MRALRWGWLVVKRDLSTGMAKSLTRFIGDLKSFYREVECCWAFGALIDGCRDIFGGWKCLSRVHLSPVYQSSLTVFTRISGTSYQYTSEPTDHIHCSITHHTPHYLLRGSSRMAGASLHPLLPGLKARVSALCQYGMSYSGGRTPALMFRG